MSKRTTAKDRSLSLYQVFVRNYAPSGTFREVEKDLDRIAAMGFDYLYLLPIHPIGVQQRKGDLGSPYAISDYWAINPEYGTLEDFKKLIQATHDHHMKIMIDIVINHTAYDHPFTQTHPEYYYHKPDGNFGNRVGAWTDILDLDYGCEALREEMINMLCYWAKLGVDGYRCDVASLVPVSFWQQAAEAVAKINPDHFWLAESVEPEFIRALRSEGFEVATDSELYTAFDCLYDYDIYDQFKVAVSEKSSLQPYKQAVRDQQWRYPANFLKLRFLENHDQPRIASYTQDHDKILNWVGYSFFVQGTAFVYAGQEAWNKHQPSLFTKDLVDWTQRDPAYEDLIHRLNEIRRMDFMGAHRQFILHDNPQEVLVCEYQCEDSRVFGIFNVRGLEGDLPLATIEGEFVNLIDNQPVIVEKGQLKLSRKPQIFVCSNLSAE